MIEVIHTTETALTASQNVPLGSVTARSNSNATLSDNTILINRVGYFDVKGQFTLTATSAGTLTVQLLANGNAINGALATQTVAEGDTISLNVDKVVKVLPTSSNSRANISFETTSACTLNNSRVQVDRIL